MKDEWGRDLRYVGDRLTLQVDFKAKYVTLHLDIEQRAHKRFCVLFDDIEELIQVLEDIRIERERYGIHQTQER